MPNDAYTLFPWLTLFVLCVTGLFSCWNWRHHEERDWDVWSRRRGTKVCLCVIFYVS